MFFIYLQQYEKTKGKIEVSASKDWDTTAEKFGDQLYKSKKLEQGYYDALLYDENHVLVDHIILVE